MIKVMEGYKLKSGANIGLLLNKLVTQARTYHGFLSAEILINTQTTSIIVMLSGWETPEDWLIWEGSKLRQETRKQIKELLRDEPRVMVYKEMPTHQWTG